MKINDLFETQQDEGFGSALGKVAGAVGKGVGAVAGGARALGTAAKAGYKAGSQGAQKSILGQVLPDINLGGTAPQDPNAPAAQDPNAPPVAPATTAPATTAAPASTAPAVSGGAPATTTAPAGNTTAKGTADFGTIQRSIKTLSPKQKTALSAQLTGKAPAAPAPEAPATAPATTAPAGPQKGQEVSLASGEKYRFAGQQWVEVDPTTGAETGGAALPAGFQKSLTGIAAKQTAAPATGAPDLKVVNGGKTAMGEGLYFRSKFLNVIL